MSTNIFLNIQLYHIYDKVLNFISWPIIWELKDSTKNFFELAAAAKFPSIHDVVLKATLILDLFNRETSLLHGKLLNFF